MTADPKHFLVCLRDEEQWYAEELQDFVPNVFLATRYTQNDATILATRLKMQGIEAATDVDVVAGRRNVLV